MSSKTAADPLEVADMLHSAAIHLLRRLRKSDVETGMSPARLSVLSVLVFGGVKTAGDLARIEQVRPPTMSRLIQALESEGLVKRRSHKQDKRASIINVTARGRRKLVNAQKRRIQKLAELMDSMKPDELETLAKAAQLIEGLTV